MSDYKSILTINAEGMSKPANTLIKKVFSALGGAFEPFQIKRVAKAKAEANLIKAESDAETNLINAKSGIEISDLERRATHRWVKEEARRQENIEKIIGKALLHLNEQSDPSKMDDDWITNFFNKSRMVSDNEMQDLWARVLAGEANSPGSYSKRTTIFLVDLDKKEAESFQALSGFRCSVDGECILLIFDTEDAIYNDKGINFESLIHLESIGLVQFNAVNGFVKKKLPKSFLVSYFGRPLTLIMKKEADNELPIGQILLTQTGRELSLMCPMPEVDGFFDYVQEKWRIDLPEIKST